MPHPLTVLKEHSNRFQYTEEFMVKEGRTGLCVRDTGPKLLNGMRLTTLPMKFGKWKTTPRSEGFFILIVDGEGATVLNWIIGQFVKLSHKISILQFE